MSCSVGLGGQTGWFTDLGAPRNSEAKRILCVDKVHATDSVR
jgi:hypothetical protein